MPYPIITDGDGWPVGEKRFHCANCDFSKDGKPSVCGRKKRVGIGYCRDHSALKGNNKTEG